MSFTKDSCQTQFTYIFDKGKSEPEKLKKK